MQKSVQNTKTAGPVALCRFFYFYPQTIAQFFIAFGALLTGTPGPQEPKSPYGVPHIIFYTWGYRASLSEGPIK